MTAFTIDELAIPATIESPDAADFIEMARVRNDIEAEKLGNRDLCYEPAELLPNWQDPYQPQRLLVARVAGQIVARAIYEAPLSKDSTEAWLNVEVLSEFRNRGIGSALLETLLGFAATDGRSVIQSYVTHKAGAGPTLPSPTGFGSIPLHSPETAFLLKHGFALEQVERMSRLALPADEALLAANFAKASEAAGADYRIVRWTGRTPESWIGDLAKLHQRMSTDAPSAGLDFSEESWDERRMRDLDDRREASPRLMIFVAAEHVPSGSLVGFSELSIPPELERPVEQQDTLVLKAHRGHRLGLLLKVANLQHLAKTHPGHPSVTTFNAEENRHMLDVNEAVGFVPVGFDGGWKRSPQP